LLELFWQLDASRSFNVIDSIIVEEGIKAGKTDNAYEKVRTELLKVYNSTDTRSEYSEEEYDKMFGKRSDYSKPVKSFIPTIEPTENGYPGLLPPVN